MNEKTINIEGMTCASCVARVEKALSSLEGMEAARVNLISENAKLIYDPSLVSDKKIKKVVESAGYKTSMEADNLAFMRNKRLIDMRKRFFWSLALSLPVFVFAMGHMLPFRNWFPGFANWQQTFYIFEGMKFSNFLQLILSTPVQFIISYPFYKAAWKSIRSKSASMDVLVVLGTTAAYTYSLFSLLYPYINPSYSGDVFFETSSILLTFIYLGKYLEEISKGKTSEAIKKLIQLRPKTAEVIRDGKEVIIPIDDVVENDICVIYPGQNIPVDGIVMEGESYVNESMITGESISVFKEKGSELIGGTINENGNIKMEAKRVGKNTTLNQIIKMVEDAQTSKIPIQKLADRISAYFVPAVVLLSLITFSVWFSLFKFGVISTILLPDGHTVFLFAFLTAITVLVISCPCALGLATPTAVMVGTGVGAENGILIRSGNALENTRKVDVVLFDKTGTITKGSPEVTDIVSIADDVSEKEILRLAASIEKSSEHSISKAIILKSEESDIKLKSVKNFQIFPGMGIEGDIDGDKIVVGNMKIVSKFGIKISENIKVQLTELEIKGLTVVFVIKEQDIVGLIALFDTVKPHAKETMALLKRQGIKSVMVSGDNKNAVKNVSNEVGIDQYYAEVLPEEKLDIVKEFQEKGLSVLFVGDGVNDAPALAQADVGIAIGTGTDVAIESGDIVLIKDDLRDVVTAIDLSKKTMRKVKTGLFWALIYNSLGIPIAAGILFLPFGFLLPAEIAGLAMALSSVSVITNALLLKRYKNPFK